jgi:DNA gyrase subunit B
VAETNQIPEVVEQAQIDIAEFPENVRLRKEMYIYSMEHQIFEIVDNAIDEALAGRCSAIAVAITDNPDTGETIVTVEDNGSGIPITPHKKFTDKSQAAIAMTVLHAGGKLGKEGGYKTATGGLHGVGASCTNALSAWMELNIKTGGKKYNLRFERGVMIHDAHIVEENVEGTGTEVTFVHDPQIWGEESIDVKKVKKRVQQLAYLNPGLVMYLYVDSKDKEGTAIKIEEQYCYPEGINAYIQKLIKSKTPLTEIIGTSGGNENIKVSIAFAYTSTYTEDIYTFCNNIPTEDGGDHLTGFRTGIANGVKKFWKEQTDKDAPFETNDILEGVSAIVTVMSKESPKFKGQSKSKIDMPEVRKITREVTEQFVYEYLDFNPDQTEIIFKKIETAKKAREAASKAREAARNKKDAFEGGLPGKIADCSSKNPEECEIYIVEGDSAGGSAKQARNRKTQAILPVFGKIMNSERQRLDTVYTNVKLKDVIKALRTSIGEDFDLAKLRYHKIILMSDADVDGAHIQTLWITYFYRFMRPIVEEGHLYIAMPPLYKAAKGKQEFYYYTDEELAAANHDKSWAIQRYKGLGEMNPEQLWDTTMNPETRSLIQVTVEDAEAADEAISICMSEDVPPRKEFIIENAKYAVLDV